MTNLFTINWTNVRSALVSAFITAFLGVAGYIIGVGDLFNLNVHALLNIGALSGLTTLVSLIKSFLTTRDGNFVGAVGIR